MKKDKFVVFIKALGDDKAAELFSKWCNTDIKPRRVETWRKRQRRPRPAEATVIVDRSKRHKFGPVTFEDIYRV